MTQTKQSPEITDTLIKTAQENLNLTSKQATKFAKQAQALRQNLALRRQQQENWEKEKDIPLKP